MNQMELATMAADPERVDLRVIASFVAPGSRVLDVGCGDGALLKLLESEKGVDGRGIELSQSGVNQAVAEGLSVIQGDADRDLATYPDAAFDFAILSQTLQATHNPRTVVEDLLRIGKRAIVSFPNFGHWRIRMQFMSYGRMPITSNLPYSWYDTPNIHFCTIKDFLTLTREVEATIEDAVCLYGDGRRLTQNAPWTIWNLLGEQAVFVLSRRPPNTL
ncbi:methionine biosynthesis protein MetW [Afifella sp. IM 167]|uniref:methionine biosynthesis protein MetW n=1 Tax=Afifella sp. IM 167 TaxID=2033586 RepID=UPI00351CD686